MKDIMLIDNRYIEIALAQWGNNYEIIPSVTCHELDKPVCAHPDMVLFKIGRKEFICAPNVYDEYKKLLSDFGVKLICGKKELKSNYPEDIAYNVLKTDNFALGNFSHTDETIINFLDKEKIKMINVKQGYSKCSVCSFSNGAITADCGIYSALKNNDVDALKIPCGEILLPGYNYGFIGGASGENEQGEIFFFGNIKKTSFGKEILNFLWAKGKTVHQIENTKLTDVGTIMFLN